jgi:hypothetical protein
MATDGGEGDDEWRSRMTTSDESAGAAGRRPLPDRPREAAAAPTAHDAPQVIRLDDRLAGDGAEQGGTLWRLGEAGRQLDADVVRLPPGAEGAGCAELGLDVVLFVVEGAGWLVGGANRQPLGPRSVVWLPHGVPGALAAGPEGLAYLAVRHRGPAPSAQALENARVSGAATVAAEGGEAPCMLDRVCAACGRVSPEASARYCGRCGEPLPSCAF